MFIKYIESKNKSQWAGERAVAIREQNVIKRDFPASSRDLRQPDSKLGEHHQNGVYTIQQTGETEADSWSS